MRQAIENINLNNTPANSYGREQRVAGLYTAQPAASSETIAGCDAVYEKGSSVKQDKTKGTDCFGEYMEAQEKLRRDGEEQLVSEEERQKEAAEEIRKNVTPEELAMLKQLGIDVSTADMSDLSGMLNTLRGNAKRQQTKEMFAEIKAANMDDVPKELSKDDLVYLLRNNLPVNTENLYKAHYSGTKASAKKLDASVFDAMKPQLEKIIEQSGCGVNEESFDAAKFLMENDLAVTPGAIRLYMQYAPQDVADNTYDNMQDEKGAKLVVPVNDAASELLTAVKLFEDVNKVTPEVVYEMAMEKKTVTIAAALHYMEKTTNADRTGKDMPDADVPRDALYMDAEGMDAEKAGAALTARRCMEEIRLSMTFKAAVQITRLNANIDTEELSVVVEELKKLEINNARSAFNIEGIDASEENIDTYLETANEIKKLYDAHAGVIATPLLDEEFSVRALNVRATTFDTAVKGYEAVGTAPRADMGDSIGKAFKNMDSLLKELGIEVNDNTLRAARIIGYNSLELTQENIQNVMAYDREVTTLVKGFYPEAVIGLIKDGINPLDVPIDELNKIIKKRNYNNGVTEADNFAKYLVDMEKQGIVDAAERESYIGLYRFMEKLSKSGDAEAGFLFANNENLTIHNLIGAMRSRRARGLDVTIDEGFGMLESIKGRSKNLLAQIEAAFDGRFTADDNASFEGDFSTDDYAEFIKLEKDVEEYIVNQSIEYNMVNAQAVDVMLHTKGGIYQMVSEFLRSVKFDDNTDQNAVDEEAENIADSLLGEEIKVDFEEALSTENILKTLNENGDLSLRYDDIRDALVDRMYSLSIGGKLDKESLKSIRLISAGFNIMGNMAKRRSYQIPIETKEGISVMRLTVNSRADQSSTVGGTDFGNAGADISIAMDMGQYGYVKGEFSLSGEVLSGQLISDTYEGNLRLSEKADEIIRSIRLDGVECKEISIGTVINGRQEALNTGSLRNGKTEDDGTGTTLDNRLDSLYKAAVSAVKAVAGLIY